MGTSDGWLIRQLTGGQRFVTDAATASRTMMLDLEKLTWSEDLLGRFELPAECLPEIVRCDECIGETDPKLFGIPIPITGLCVDQHAALFGQGCFNTLSVKQYRQRFHGSSGGATNLARLAAEGFQSICR